MPLERRTITFSGRVQGVGFRATTLNLAEGLPLAGMVRNLDDGSVELVVEGPPEAIDSLLDRLHEHFRSFIRTMHERRAPPTGTLPPGLQIDY